MVKGDVHRETLRFTIPEGLFLEDIASRLADSGIVVSRILIGCRPKSVAGLLVYPGTASGIDVPEGYLFPNTYEIWASAENKEELVIAIMLRQFDRVFTEEMRAEARTWA